MKNFVKLLITALVAVIGLSFTACGDGSGDNGNGTGTALTITTATLPSGTVGTAYSQTLAATGDTPITWSKESGDLPNGLTLSTAGVISGTPTTANTFNFTVKATNATGSGTKQLSITIASSGGVAGILTITNIPSQYNGKYAFYATDRGTPTLIGLQSFDATTNTATLNQISNGSVSIPMHLSSNGSLSAYSGNDTVTPYNNVAFVEIRNTSTFTGVGWATDALDFMIFPSITFSNGGSALSWTNGGGSGTIPADLQGTWKSVIPGAATVTLNANSVVVEQVSNGQTIKITRAISACIQENISEGEFTSAYSLVQKVTAIETTPNGIDAGTTVGAFFLKPAVKFNTAKNRMSFSDLIFTKDGGGNAGTYIITGSGTTFTATKNNATVGTANQAIQTVIDAIRTDANGANCTIQFGNGTNALNIGTATIAFNNNTGGTWGAITITGGITSSANNTITLGTSITVNSTANISTDANNRVLQTQGGDITITGGTINGRYISNSINSTMIINGGTINARIDNSGAVTVNNGTITSGSGGTIDNYGTSSTGIISTITINGGTVETTGTTSSDNAIRNKGPHTVNITGGTIKAMGSAYAIYNYNGDNGEVGTVTISPSATIIGNKYGVN